jgi:hypothetical protein
MKKTARTTTKKTTRRTRSAQPKAATPVALNAQTIAVSILTAYQREFVPQTVLDTWQLMPEILTAIAEGEADSINRTTLYKAIERAHERIIAESRAEGDDDGTILYIHNAYSIAEELMDAHDTDLEGTLRAHWSGIGLHVGIAFACYILTHQQAVTVTPGGTGFQAMLAKGGRR